MGVALVDLANCQWLRESVRKVDLPQEISHRYVAAWKKDNNNPYIARFLELLKDALLMA